MCLAILKTACLPTEVQSRRKFFNEVSVVLAIDWAGSEGGERSYRSEETKLSGARMPSNAELDSNA